MTGYLAVFLFGIVVGFAFGNDKLRAVILGKSKIKIVPMEKESDVKR